MIRVALICLAILAGCSDSGQPMPAQYSPDSFPVTMFWYEDASELRFASAAHRVPVDAEAFSIMTYRGESYRCEIHIVRPKDLSPYTQELIGHEFAHCIYGAWHK